MYTLGKPQAFFLEDKKNNSVIIQSLVSITIKTIANNSKKYTPASKM